MNPWILAFWLSVPVSSLLCQFGPRAAGLTLKTLPLILILAELARAFKGSGLGRFRLLIWLGILLSAIADLVIVVSFVAGIALFLVVHLLYLGGMGWSAKSKGRQLVAALPAVGLWLTMVPLLLPRVTHELQIPVIAYVSVISLMWARAWGRALVTDKRRSSSLMLWGATVFALSDSIIAMNRWLFDVPYPNLAILLTYYTGQWLISRAALGAGGRDISEQQPIGF